MDQAKEIPRGKSDGPKKDQESNAAPGGLRSIFYNFQDFKLTSAYYPVCYVARYRSSHQYNSLACGIRDGLTSCSTQFEREIFTV